MVMHKQRALLTKKIQTQLRIPTLFYLELLTAFTISPKKKNLKAQFHSFASCLQGMYWDRKHVQIKAY